LKYAWMDDETGHNLNIKPVRSIPLSVVNQDVEELMDDFLKYSQPLHKPMAYIFRNDLDLPYEESIYPVAEELLLVNLMS